MRTYVVILFVLGFVCSSAAQIKLGSDFRLSNDNKPSTIIQNTPKIFCRDTTEFLATWTDYRNGEPGIYAQWFDASGNKKGKNFQLESDLDIRFLPDGSFIEFSEEYNYYYFCCDNYQLKAKIHYKDGTSSNKFYVAGTGLGCDVNCTGIDFDMITKNDTMLLFLRNEGYVALKKIDRDGNVEHLDDSIDFLPRTAPVISAAINTDNNYVLSYFDASRWYDEPDTSIGIYAAFFSSNDSASVKYKLIQQFITDDYYYYEYIPRLKVLAVSDSLFEFFWLRTDSLTFNFQKYNSRGEAVSDLTSIKLPFETLDVNWYREFLNFSVSPQKDGSFAVFITAADRMYSSDTLKSYNGLFYFDENGNLTDHKESGGWFPNLGREIFKTGANTFYTVQSDKKDVYLLSLTDLTITDSLLINDDSEGSNELNAGLRITNTGNNYAIWSDEQQITGQQFGADGTLTGPPEVLNSTNLIFSPNGKRLSIWKKDISMYYAISGITIYDIDGSVISEDTLTSTDDYYMMHSAIIRLSDSIFVMYYTSRNTLNVRTLDQNFNTIKQIEFADENGYWVKLFRESESSFWLGTFNNVQLFSSELEPLNEKYSPFYANIYLGDSTFVFIDYQYGYPAWVSRTLYGTVFNTSGDTLVKKFYIANGVNEHISYLLPNKDFLAVYQQGQNLFARAFSKEGKAKTDSFMIHDNISSFKKSPAVMFSNNKLYFTWSDARNKNMGYDVYGSVFDYSSVVSVFDKKNIYTYKLHQNYPNPFNPSTVIRYNIADQQRVKVTVFDILGKQLSVLVNGMQSPGEHEVVFNSGGLPSGIYFYRIDAGSFSETRKMLLLR